MKRIRITKRMRQHFDYARQRIISEWCRIAKRRDPVETFSFASVEKLYGPFAPSLREALWYQHYALWNYHAQAHARWQLYLDGRPVTCDEISIIADKEESEGKEWAETWARVTGRHEWDDTHRPFYDDAAPRGL